MKFTESRGNDGERPAEVPFSAALMSPSASFGGIYCPAALPPLPPDFLAAHLDSSYKRLAQALLEHLGLDIDAAILRAALDRYDRFDDREDPVPVIRLDDRLFVAELYHGPTRAFKDIALQPFGTILSALAKRDDRQFLILTATSGDTGPAALETFRDAPNIRVVCLYPAGGTSDVQRLQMVTEAAPNLKVLGIDGNFDDAQTALKSLLASASFNARLRDLDIALSAANSVNFGRIAFQIVYQFHAYLALVRQREIEIGRPVALHIPSGNFGNALGAYYARALGLPVARIVIASNANNVLTEWIETGRYDMSKRQLIATASPAMDILKSSNVERVLFDLYGAARTRELMTLLDTQGWYQLEDAELARLQAVFAAVCCSDDEALAQIRAAWARGYLLDPHTATCLKACRGEPWKAEVNIVHSTAEWTKFAPVVERAIHGAETRDDRAALRAIADAAGIGIPAAIANLFDRPVAHPEIVAPGDIEARILDFLGA